MALSIHRLQLLYGFKNVNLTFSKHPLFATAVLTLENLLKMPFYAVAQGRESGIFGNWDECRAQVNGFSGARYKKFNTEQEANAFIRLNSGQSSNSNSGVANVTFDHYGRKYISGAGLTSAGTSKSYHNGSSSAPKQNLNIVKDECNRVFDDGDIDMEQELNSCMDNIELKLKKGSARVQRIQDGKSPTTPQTRKRTLLLTDTPPTSKSIRSPTSKRFKSGQQFAVDEDDYVQVYTDGACTNNGRIGAQAGLGVFFGDDHPLNVSKPVSGRATNNCGEIQAASQALRLARQAGVKKICINTDSQFLIDSVTKWMPGWKRKSWKIATGGPVKNEKDFKELDQELGSMDIKWNYVKAHQGIYGNEKADEFAKRGASLYKNV